MPSDILNSLQKSMLLNPVKKEQKGYFRKKTEQQKWDDCKPKVQRYGISEIVQRTGQSAVTL